MKTYLITLFAASFTAALVHILAPDGALSRYLRFLTALFLVCVLIAPLGNGKELLQKLANGEFSRQGDPAVSESDARDELQATLDRESKTYFTQSLTRMLETQFGIETGNAECAVEWSDDPDTPTPVRVTVILSGKAVWKDSGAIRSFVTELLGCPCVTAIQ